MGADPLRMFLVLRRGAVETLERAAVLGGAAAVGCVREFPIDPEWRANIVREETACRIRYERCTQSRCGDEGTYPIRTDMQQSNVCRRVVAVGYRRFENRAGGSRSRQVEQDRAGVCPHAVIDVELFILGNTACFNVP